MEPERPDEAIASLLNSMNKGQYLLLVMAMRRAGGEMRIDWDDFAAAAKGSMPAMTVDASDGPIVMRLDEPSR